MANSSISLTSLDFDSLKTDLKTYLKSQTAFKDYDFDGANMNVLLDILSYNTYLNSFYLNMVASEMFMDSAQVRDSVVSHAKNINYIPDSMKSAKGLVNITFNTTGITDTFEIPKGTQFSGKNANGSFVFTTDRNITATSTSNVFNFANVEIFEGTYISESFVVDYQIENQKFILSNPTIDTDSIDVIVVENNANTQFIKADNLYDLNAQSNSYFLQATTNNRYEILFGDNVFGRYPLNNAVVLITYRITRGTAGSGVNNFFLDKDLGAYNGGTTTYTISTVSASSDGAERENTESIRFRAPRSYQTQDRAVTVNDYKSLIFKNFKEVKDVNVFGGEEIPGSVAYGRVYVCPSTYSGAPLTSQRKTDILTFLNDKKIVNIKPYIMDPEYIYIVPTIDVYVNFNNTTYSPSEIRSLVLNNVTNFNNNNLELFNTPFRFSKFISSLNSVDASIESNQVKVYIYKNTTPKLNTPQTLTFSFNNKLTPASITSNLFLLADGNTYQLTDYNPKSDTYVRAENSFNITNTKPVIYLKQITTNDNPIYIDVGTVDYESGIVRIRDLTIIDFLGSNGIRLNAYTYEDDVYGKLNNIVEIDVGSATVNVYSV